MLSKRNPYYSNVVAAVKFLTPTTESSNARTQSLQLQDRRLRDLAQRGTVRAFLCDDANGDTPSVTPPNGGIAAGTDGSLVAGGSTPPYGLLAIGTLAIDAVAEKFKTTTVAVYTAGGLTKTKAATTAIVFSAAHKVTAAKFGVVLIQIDSAGTITTKVPASTQAYNSAPLALAALPAPDTGKVALGYIAIAAGVADWTANTDDMTNGSDLTTAAFVDANVASLVPLSFTLTSESDGDIDVTITETGVKTYYLAVVLPDGSISVSSAIAFV